MSADRCPHFVHWWDIDTTVRCVRPAHDTGPHRDGTRWFDDLGQQVDGTVHRYTPFAAVPRENAGRSGHRALSPDQVRTIRELRANGSSVADIARALGTDYQVTYTCARGLTYREQVSA